MREIPLTLPTLISSLGTTLLSHCGKLRVLGRQGIPGVRLGELGAQVLGRHLDSWRLSSFGVARTGAECRKALGFPMNKWGEEKRIVSLLLWEVEGSFLRQGAAQALPLALIPFVGCLGRCTWWPGRRKKQLDVCSHSLGTV